MYRDPRRVRDSADPGRHVLPRCRGWAGSVRQRDVEGAPHWAVDAQLRSKVQQLGWASVVATYIPLQSGVRERFSEAAPKPHQIDDGSCGS